MQLRILAPSLILLTTACSGPQSVAPEDVSYEHDIAPVVTNFCTTCHAGDDPEGGFALTDYASVREEAELGELLARIEDHRKPMPESGLMPRRYRNLFHTWAEAGFPETGDRPRPLPEPGVAMESQILKNPIQAVDLDTQGFDFLEKMQGHWAGDLWLMGTDMPWFSFDYRAISPSHVHGIFEGGSMGNLFTSFFLAELEGQMVLMARNGGILNGIYRTSYFLLDEASSEEGGVSRYRFVDAFGGAGIMWMEFEFQGEAIRFASYTSRFGVNGEPSLHMRFEGKRQFPEIAAAAAEAVGFPQFVPAYAFPEGLPKPNWGDEPWISSASYIWQDRDLDLIGLGRISEDPIRVDHMPHLAQLAVQLERNEQIAGKKLLLYLSKDALTKEDGKFRTAFGYLREDIASGILSFPELSSKASAFTFTYLHPGEYWLTVVADMNGDGFPSPGDVAAPSVRLVVEPESKMEVEVRGITVQN